MPCRLSGNSFGMSIKTTATTRNILLFDSVVPSRHPGPGDIISQSVPDLTETAPGVDSQFWTHNDDDDQRYFGCCCGCRFHHLSSSSVVFCIVVTILLARTRTQIRRTSPKGISRAIGHLFSRHVFCQAAVAVTHCLCTIWVGIIIAVVVVVAMLRGRVL